MINVYFIVHFSFYEVCVPLNIVWFVRMLNRKVITKPKEGGRVRACVCYAYIDIRVRYLLLTY